MNEYRMTDQTATTIALHGLINDMHHVLGRIVTAAYMATFLAVVTAAIDYLAGRPVSMGIDLMGGVVFLLAGRDTQRRQRKYRPARAGIVAAKGCGGDEEERA